MEFRELMRQFGAKIGIDGLVPDDMNACHVEIDGMRVSFMEDLESGTVLTWGEVCEPPTEGVTILYRILMESMFPGRGAEGATFSIRPESGKIYLHRTDPLAVLDPDAFGKMLEGFVNLLERWRRTIADFRPVAAEIDKAKSSEASPISLHADGFLQV